jgi:membrane protein required for colicin V production
MQWVDWAILAIVSISAIISLFRGFVKEALSLGAWFISFLTAKAFYQDFEPLLLNHIETPSLRFGVAWAAVFLATLVVLSLVNYLLARLVEKGGLSGMDRLMGMVFGAFRGVLICSLIIILLKNFSMVEKDSWWQKSRLVPHVQVVGYWFYEHVKGEITSSKESQKEK